MNPFVLCSQAVREPRSWTFHLSVHLGREDEALSRTVLPVVSMPITITPSIEGEEQAGELEYEYDALGIQNCRALRLPVLEKTVLVAESPGQLGKATCAHGSHEPSSHCITSDEVME
jgi:hypothetical protein